MRVRGLAFIVLALVFAGSAALLARVWLSAHAPAPAAAAPAPARAVLVARDALPMGQILKADNLAWQTWPEGSVNSGYILQGTRTPADFAGSVLRAPIGKGEPITADQVASPGNRGFLAAVLRPGTRAVSVAVDATSGISGFVFPGDQVDVLLTHILQANTAQAGSQTQRKATETILRNVRVIAIDQKLSSKQDEPTVAHDVTLEVTPKQSEVIAVANAMGKLSLSLRSIGRDDDEPADDPSKPAIPDRKRQTYTLDSEASRLLGPVAGAGAHVVVIHGSQSEDVTFGAGK